MRPWPAFLLAVSLGWAGCAPTSPPGKSTIPAADPHGFERPGPAGVRITIDGPADDQLTIDNCLSALQNGFDESAPVSPFGVTSQRFAGRMFWDADMWVFPYASFCDVGLATRIAQARIAQLPQARRNYREWVAAGRPKASGQHVPEPALTRFLGGVQAAKYAWESDAEGRETAPSDTRYEEHIGGDVAWMLRHASSLGLVDAPSAVEANRAVAAYYLDRGSLQRGRGFGILGVVSPDEWHKADNDLFTNSVAYATLESVGVRLNPGLVRSDREGTWASFDGDDYRQYQQAAAMLVAFPLDSVGRGAEAKRLLDFYKDRHAAQGPAMSDAVSATVAARVGLPDLGLDLWRRNLKGRSEDNAWTFREKPAGESYFLTGAAGMVNTVLFGFLGLEMPVMGRLQGEPGIDLGNGFVVRLRPSLPAGWKSVSIDGLTVKGRVCRITASKTSIEIEWRNGAFGSNAKRAKWHLPSK